MIGGWLEAILVLAPYNRIQSTHLRPIAIGNANPYFFDRNRLCKSAVHKAILIGLYQTIPTRTTLNMI
jgi:hypothetical protein